MSTGGVLLSTRMVPCRTKFHGFEDLFILFSREKRSTPTPQLDLALEADGWGVSGPSTVRVNGSQGIFDAVSFTARSGDRFSSG